VLAGRAGREQRPPSPDAILPHGTDARIKPA
jgi:hypothetical protein